MVRPYLFVLLAACQGGLFGDDADPSGPDEGESGLVPSVTLLNPAEGEGYYGADIPVRFEVKDFTLDAAGLGGANAPDRGHAHVYLDGELRGDAAEAEIEVADVFEGTHTLEVRLATNDHTELDAEAFREFPVAIPIVAVASPSDGAVLASSNTPVSFSVAGFDVLPTRGEADLFGEGHVVVKADGAFRDWSVDPLLPVEVTGLAPGPHTVQIELVSNTGKPLSPPVQTEVSVTVPDTAPGVYFDREVAAAPWDSAVLPLSLTTSNFTLAEPDGTGLPLPGVGNWHLYMDGEWVEGAARSEILLENLAPGEHLFEVVLAGNDIIELPVRDRMWVTIPADRPNVMVTQPGRDWAMGPSFEVTFGTENFTLDGGAMGGANAPHAGHAQVWVDGVMVGETAAGLHAVSGLLPGPHELRVELVNNDRTPLDPPVYSAFPFVVR